MEDAEIATEHLQEENANEAMIERRRDSRVSSRFASAGKIL
jgi:hypothetical protein